MDRDGIGRIVLAALAVAATCARGQDFECQAGACVYLFPTPRAAPGDCEGVSWNGRGVATVDVANGCGFPASGSRYLRVAAGGPETTVAGTAPAGFAGNAAEVFVRVPSGALDVSLAWDFYNAEGAGSPFNDGMLVDVIDGAGVQLSVLAFADVTSPLGSCTDVTACGSGAAGVDLGAPGAEAVTNAPLPAGAAFLRFAVWNGVDNNFPSHGVVDDVTFALPAPTYPGTGGDVVLLSDVVPGAAPSTTPAPSAFPDVRTAAANDLVVLRFESPAGTLTGSVLFVGFNLLPTAAFPPPDPLLATLGVQLRPGFEVVTIFGFLPALAPGGSEFSFAAPPLSGTSLLVQGAVASPLSPNGVLFATDGHEIRFP